MNIDSLDNKKVKIWTSLNNKKYRDKYDLFLVEGDHLVNIALENNLVVDLITTEDNISFPNKYIVTEEIMRKISSQVTISKVAATIKLLKEREIEGNTIILDRLQDPGNLGTIIRSAVAFNFKNIVLGNGTVDIYNDKVIRASEGMIFNLNIIKRDIDEIINELKNKDYIVVGTSLNTDKIISDIKNDSNIALIIGNEGDGMNENIDTDELIKIPMNNLCESLNAGVSASILMYEVDKWKKFM